MDYSLFMMPLHPPGRNVTETLQEDRQAVVLGDRLGFKEAYVGEHATDAAERTIGLRLAVMRDHFGFGQAQLCGDVGKGGWHEWEVVLPVAQQLQSGVHVQKPMRAAREVKKMPLGEGTSKRAKVAKLRVSITLTRWSSRLLIQTLSPRGVNSMCSTALPGVSVCTTA